MSVIVSRALPDVRDGLKPVHRRMLTAMNDLNLQPGKPYRKSAKITGDTTGNYHPHGTASVYDTLVRMAQDFCLRYPLVDGQGNFGSVDGDAAAAERYTEARLTKFATEMLRDLDKETVDFVPNYDGSREMPSVMPARVPNLLVNGADGIAVGMATKIPPHNLGEICDGLVALLDNPDLRAGTRCCSTCRAPTSRPAASSTAGAASTTTSPPAAAASWCARAPRSRWTRAAAPRSSSPRSPTR